MKEREDEAREVGGEGRQRHTHRHTQLDRYIERERIGGGSKDLRQEGRRSKREAAEE